MVSRVFMVRPAAFGPNSQTADSNAFQSREVPPHNLHELARMEFGRLTENLRAKGVLVEVFDEPKESANSDAVFPNNWVSFHPEVDRVFLYPMLAPKRRDERRPDWVHSLTKRWARVKITDLTDEELSGRYLEGTGALVFDPVDGSAYMARSPRSNDFLAQRVVDLLNVDLRIFNAADDQGREIYHTNVIMGIGRQMALGCWSSILNNKEREVIITSLTANQRPILHLTQDQMNAFAGNWIELEGSNGPLFTASRTAWNTLSSEQQRVIEGLYTPVITGIPNIEHFGGGSVRCMICTVDRR
ncbi:MAG: hypothetical protein J4F31_01520 [Flavobacteriales bacterium]|nr:hypothetical protein [Flavobacteriales bacterium]